MHIFISYDSLKLKGHNVSVWFKILSFCFSAEKANKEKYIDNDEMWETAEGQLRAILKELGIEFYEAEGEAAFYGPKIDWVAPVKLSNPL